MEEKQGYILKKEYRNEKAVVKVFSPILTDKERARRMAQIHKAAESLLKAVI